MAKDVQIRPAGKADLPGIAAIQRDAPEASDWNPADYLQYLCSVAVIDGDLAGFLVTRQVAAAETEILNMAVAPAFRRRGIGKRLLQPALHGDVFLEVRASNIPAQRLYQSLGFLVVGQRLAYYSSPTEDAIVMRFVS